MPSVTDTPPPEIALGLEGLCTALDERMAFLFDRRTVQMSGLMGELLVPSDPEDRFYDQIAWFTEENSSRPALSMRCTAAGHFDFTAEALPRQGLSRHSLSWRISDHYPLRASFDRSA